MEVRLQNPSTLAEAGCLALDIDERLRPLSLVVTIAVVETTNLRQVIVRACTDGLGYDRGVTAGVLEEE